MPKLTKRRVDSFEKRDKAYFEWDSEIKGFGVRIMPSGTKTYQVQYRKGGRTRRASIGRHGNITADQARNRAKEIMGELSKGENPVEEIAQHRRAPSGHQMSTRCRWMNGSARQRRGIGGFDGPNSAANSFVAPLIRPASQSTHFLAVKKLANKVTKSFELLVIQ